jgi:hypothetical protein
LRVVFHLGAHQTDQDRLVRSLLRNRDVLARQQVAVPGPGRYRTVLRDVVNRLRGEPATEEAEELLIEAIAHRDPPATLFLSDESFICPPQRALDEGRLYARSYRTAWLRQMFPRHQAVFAIGLRDPSSLVPALFHARANRDLDFEDYITGVDPHALRWSAVIRSIRACNPDTEIIVWCNEDTPLVWGAVMQAVTGVAPDLPLHGLLDIAHQIVTQEGAAAIEAHFGRPPHFDRPEVRSALGRLIEAYARPDELTEVIDLPGWDGDLIARLTALYDEDVAWIAAMPGVRFIAP